MTSDKTETRRQYSAAIKAQVVAECGKSGASVAKVAMAHGINANVVHRWRQLARAGKVQAPATTGEFIALALAMAAVPTVTPADIRVELRCGAVTMNVTWPASAAADCAAWIRELLR